MLAGLAYSAFQQYRGDFLTEIVRVEFGDETVPYLGLFNGCYKRSSKSTSSERPIYEQLGSESVNVGKFGYCSDRSDDSGGWMFFFGGKDDEAECKNNITASEETRTFDLLEAAKSQWYTNRSLPLEYLQMYKVGNETECGSDRLVERTRDSCKEIELVLEGRSPRIFQQHLGNWSHPVYDDVDESNHTHAIIFTGRRWVLANTSKIGALRSDPTRLYEEMNELHKYAMDTEDGWIRLISEKVDYVNDQGSPLGLQWYFPRVVTGNESNLFNFHLPDLTRPVDPFSCLTCNSKTNPCLFEGICNDADGTCDCKNGASGKLCRRKPQPGDGVCHSYRDFNSVENDFDGGDCCGGTCQGYKCGKSGIEKPYGIDTNNTSGNEFKALVWAELVSTKIPVDSFGYEHCKDPSQATFTVEIKPEIRRKFHDDLLGPLYDRFPDFEWREASNCFLDNLRVRCNGDKYMTLPATGFATTKNLTECPSYSQSFQVPYGSRCDIWFLSPVDMDVKLHYGDVADQNSMFEGLLPRNAQWLIIWNVPASKCITNALLSNVAGSFLFHDGARENVAARVLSNDKTAQSLCSSGDNDRLLERFALAAFHVILNATDSFIDSKRCEVSLASRITTKCDADNFVTSFDFRGIEGFQYEMVSMDTVLVFFNFFRRLENLSVLRGFLAGSIPSEIGNFQSLTGLYLGENSLTGTIPLEIGNLTSLKFLTLYKNTLTGPIPSEIGKCTSLTYLRVYNNALTGPIPSEIGSLESLRDLELYNNTLTGPIPSEIGKSTSLTYLRLYNNPLAGPIPSEIGSLESLLDLELYNNALTGPIPSEIGYLTSLRELHLYDNTLSGPIPTEIGRLKRLTSLQGLALYNNALTGPIPSEIGYLTSLKRLYLSNNTLTGPIPSEIGNLGSLWDLKLYDNALTGRIPSEIGNLTHLLDLYLYNNALTGPIPNEIGSLTKLEELYLNNNYLDGRIPSEILSGIKSLKSLKRLHLSNNTLTGPIPSEIGKLHRLSSLYFNDNALTGPIPSEIGKLMDFLTHLHLHSNTLTGSLPSEIGYLRALTRLNKPRLEELYLYNNTLTGRIPSEIGNLTRLSILALGYNSLTGFIPDEIRNLTKNYNLEVCSILPGNIQVTTADDDVYCNDTILW